MSELLDDADQEFLLGIVDDPNSDYNDELDGWANYSITADPEGLVLKVEFESGEENDAERTITTGRWRLSYLDGAVTLKGERDGTS